MVVVAQSHQPRVAVRGVRRPPVGVHRVGVQGADDRGPDPVEHRHQGLGELVTGVVELPLHGGAQGAQRGEGAGGPQPQTAQTGRPGLPDGPGLHQPQEDQLVLRGVAQCLDLHLEAGEQRERRDVPAGGGVAGGHRGVGGTQSVGPRPGEGGPVLRDAGGIGGAPADVAAVGLAAREADGDRARPAAQGLLQVGVHEVQPVIGMRDDLEEGLGRRIGQGPSRSCRFGRTGRVVRQPGPYARTRRRGEHTAAGGLKQPAAGDTGRVRG